MKKIRWLAALLTILAIPFVSAGPSDVLKGVWNKILSIGSVSFLQGMELVGFTRILLAILIFAVFFSVIPLIGPWLIWVPVAIYLFISGNTLSAVIFTVYCAIGVSSIDNLLRPYIIARRTGVSSVVILVGMIGGIFVFGILGIILGPLILAYLILFLEAYRTQTLPELFHPEE